MPGYAKFLDIDFMHSQEGYKHFTTPFQHFPAMFDFELVYTWMYTVYACLYMHLYSPLYTLDMQCLLITYTMSSHGKYTCCLACGVHVCDPPCGQSIVFGCFPFPSQARRRRAPLLCWRSREPEHHRRWTNWGWFEQMGAFGGIYNFYMLIV